MGKLFIIMGKSASGKDTVFHALINSCEVTLKEVVSYTTRPIRAGEAHGKEYYFVDIQELQKLTAVGKVIECRDYNTVHGTWSYFTVDDGRMDLTQFDYAMISTLEGYEKIRNHFGSENVVPIYLTVDDFTRMERALSREKQQKSPSVAELCRRYLADEEDFSNVKLKAAGITKSIGSNTLEGALGQIVQLIKSIE